MAQDRTAQPAVAGAEFSVGGGRDEVLEKTKTETIETKRKLQQGLRVVSCGWSISNAWSMVNKKIK